MLGRTKAITKALSSTSAEGAWRVEQIGIALKAASGCKPRRIGPGLSAIRRGSLSKIATNLKGSPKRDKSQNEK
jgi:hypothetical protein